MGLVDYSSSSDSESTPPPAKKLSLSLSPSQSSSHPLPQPAPQTSSLPPLPSTFHDLYASTVRQSTTDDPTLHQGRRRQIPHVAGNWPSHLCIEWRPSSAQHALLASFVSKIQSSVSASGVELNGFLTSDLGAPLPLHVSLSRPFVLSTESKDEFLEQVTDRVWRTRMAPFTLRCEGGLEWHRTPESNRSFLVLRVRSCFGKPSHSGQLNGSDKKEQKKKGKDFDDGDRRFNHNPELTVLLVRCNTTVAAHGQPQLYQWAEDDEARISDAFHVSIAWSFAEPDEELRSKTAEVFADPAFGDAIRKMGFEVDGVKAKIGNVVNHIPLAKGSGWRARGLFGI